MKAKVRFVAQVQRPGRAEPETYRGEAELDEQVDPRDRPALLAFLTALVQNLIGPVVVMAIELIADHFTHH